jgi:segregation and condensation protein A
MGITPEQLAMIAARAMTPKVAPTVGLEHLHAPQVSVREQAGVMAARLRSERICSFRALVADADSTLVIVARFLALLELFREAAIAFEQEEALGELTVRWTGQDEGELDVGDEFDEGDEADTPEDAADRQRQDLPQQIRPEPAYPPATEHQGERT